MKLKELQSLLQDVQPFESPKPDLEQYPTGPHLAACMLFTIDNSFDDLQGKTVVDLGSGTGMLSIGCAVLGAGHVVGIEIDQDAIDVAVDNLAAFEGPLPVDIVQCDVLTLLPDAKDAAMLRDDAAASASHYRGRGLQGGRPAGRGAGRGRVQQRHRPRQGTDRRQRPGDSGARTHSDSEASSDGDVPNVESTSKPDAGYSDDAETSAAAVPSSVAIASSLLQRLRADVVVLNPPFGTRAWGADVAFLRAALAIAAPGGRVYSLHKSSTRQHIQTVADRELGPGNAQVVAELRYDLPATMAFHRHKSLDIQVDLWRFQATGGVQAQAEGRLEVGPL